MWKGPGVLSRLLRSGRCPALELAPARGQRAPVGGVCAMACSARSLWVDSYYPVYGAWAWGISIIREHVRNAESRALPRTY